MLYFWLLGVFVIINDLMALIVTLVLTVKPVINLEGFGYEEISGNMDVTFIP